MSSLEINVSKVRSEKSPKAHTNSGTITQSDNDFTKAQSATHEICEKMDVSVTSFDAKAWLGAVDEYITVHKRIAYTAISTYIYNKFANTKKGENTAEEFGIIFSNLDAASNYCKEHTDEFRNSDLSKIIFKIYDHSNLAYRQLTSLANDDEKLNQIAREEMKPIIEKINQEMPSQLIGLVSIFTALSFVIFGGISSLDSILTSVSSNSNSILPSIIVSLCWAFCIFNLLVLFMKYVLKIIGKENTSPYSLTEFVQKNPACIFMNFGIFTSLLVCSAAHYCIKNNIGQNIYKYLIGENGDILFIIIVILTTLIIGALWKKLKNIFKDSFHFI